MPTALNRRRLILGAVLALLVGRLVVLVIELGMQALSTDIDRYFEIATERGRPYGEVAVEYPPLTVGLLKVIAMVLPQRGSFGVGILLVGFAADLAIAAMLKQGWGLHAALVFLVIDSLLFHLVLSRLDFLVTAIAVAAALAWRRRQPSLTGVLIVAATATKLWPAVLAVFFLSAFTERDRIRFAIAAVATGAATLAVWLGLGGLAGPVQVLGFRGARGWQVESGAGAVVRVFTGETASLEAGAHRFGHVPGGLALGLALLGAAVAATAAWRAGRRQDLAGAWLVGVGALLLTSSLFSPQFLVWLFPAGAIAWTQRNRQVTVILAMVGVLTLLDTRLYGSLVGGRPLAEAVVITRNASLLLLALAAASRVARPRSRSLPERTSVR